MTGIDLSVAIPPSFEAARHIATAEKLGYRRAYLYDTPFEGGDVWLDLHRAAELTTTIELGPAVLIPTLRHPLVNAAQTVSLHRQAPGRIVSAFGTGFSSRAAMGQPPIRWSYMESHIRTYQALLAGETVDWEGAAIKLMLTTAHADTLPLRIPLLLAATGPKGAGVAKRLGVDGLISMFDVVAAQREFPRAVVATMGTVIDDDEDPAGERVRAAVGPSWAAAYHYTYTVRGAETVREMPGGQAWLEVIEKVPHALRHLHIHQGHMMEMNDADLAAWRAGGHASVASVTLTGDAARVRTAVSALARAGATEIMFEPSGPDIDRELETFLAAVRSSPR
ncbi:LLM class flavin-dependent oxidoreductase [Mycolicibacter sinensis]|uniref:5,10-methylene tetrahydromethanopterin reductase n=1 Tax=Mycolicibacter sinensis (strain JDM601) TaxID=875328 RepID=A0A1A2Y1C8_MYCSD|nr:LLM class flavin-dependent oxidoreductase [Mycolicibacter sinensis]OBH15559.1 5,10-methylene tetrahydromethanopterin reductase [Mycolicibacter sinensis]OBI30936.1 5,10-methylene tetrahydromethanopterin reductase [Mycolicibacter sinensis]